MYSAFKLFVANACLLQDLDDDWQAIATKIVAGQELLKARH